MQEIIVAPYFTYDFVCLDANGNEKWTETVKNVVTTQGKNDLLDKYFAGSTYTAAWYCGLISSVSYTATAATDTAANINTTNGWKEAGNANAPTYTAPRKTISFSAASSGSKATSTACVFSITGTGTVQGAFVIGSGASTTIDNTTGVLYSASAFGSSRAVVNGDTLNVSLTLSV